MSNTPSRPSTPLTTTTTHPAHTLLSHAHSPATATTLFTDKILHKPLLLTTSNTENSRAKRRHIRERKRAYYLKHARPRPLSARERRVMGLYNLDLGLGLDLEAEDGIDDGGGGGSERTSASANANAYQVYAGLNGLWNGYILELLGFTRDGVVVADKNNSNNSAAGGGGGGRNEGNRNSGSKDGHASGEQAMRKVTAASAGSLLASADYHGMEVEVVRCADVARVGLKGIVVRETRSTFTLVCEETETRDRARKKRRKIVGETRSEGVGLDGNGDSQLRVRGESHSNSASRSDSGLKSRSEAASRINTRTESSQQKFQKKAPNTGTAQHTHTHSHDEDAQQRQNSHSMSKSTNTPNSNLIPKPPPKTTRSKIRTILKKGAVFRVTILLPVPPTAKSETEMTVDSASAQEQSQYERRLVVDLHGDQLEMRPVERAVRKFKWRVGRA